MKGSDMASPPLKTQKAQKAARARLQRLLAEGNADQIEALFEELLGQCETEAARAETEAARAGEFVEEADQLGERVRHLEIRVKQLTRLLYGRKSEKLSQENLAQLALAFGGDTDDGTEPDVPTPASPEEQDSPPAPPAGEGGKDKGKGKGKGKGKKKRPNHPGRSPLSPNLERIIVLTTSVPESERACACCGENMQTIDYVEHETPEYVPAKIVVHVERREKLACKNKNCQGDIITAARLNKPRVETRVGASLLAHLIESKCDDALPIYRQQDQLLRLGFDIPLNTLYSYWNFALDLLIPVGEATLGQVLDDSIVRIDDTGLRVLDESKPKGAFRGHLWAFKGVDSPMVGYQFTKTWKAEEITPWIAAIDGFIQVDDYKGYSIEILGPDGKLGKLVPEDRRLGCMMHVRRRFYEAFTLGDKRAGEPLMLIRNIYKIEAEAKSKKLSPEQRHALRQERSIPLLRRFHKWVDDIEPRLGKSSKLARAVGYAVHQRPFVDRCFTDGRFEIDNGEIERTLKEPCIGRRNFLHTGSVTGGKRLATAYTLVQSCRALNIPVSTYLVDVIEKLASGWPLRRLSELIPDQWARARGLLAAPGEPNQ